MIKSSRTATKETRPCGESVSSLREVIIIYFKVKALSCNFSNNGLCLRRSPCCFSCYGSYYATAIHSPLYLLFFSLLFPLNTSCFPGPALSHKAVSSLMFSCIILLPLCTSQVTRPVRETAQYQAIHPSDITLFSCLGISLLSSYHLGKSGYCGFFRGTS